MTTYWIIDSIQNARTLSAIEFVEQWINKVRDRKTAAMLADMALIRKCELLTARYTVE